VTAAQHKHTSSTSHPSTTSKDAADAAAAAPKSFAEQHKAHATQVLAVQEQLHALNVKVRVFNQQV